MESLVIGCRKSMRMGKAHWMLRTLDRRVLALHGDGKNDVVSGLFSSTSPEVLYEGGVENWICARRIALQNRADARFGLATSPLRMRRRGCVGSLRLSFAKMPRRRNKSRARCFDLIRARLTIVVLISQSSLCWLLPRGRGSDVVLRVRLRSTAIAMQLNSAPDGRGTQGCRFAVRLGDSIDFTSSGLRSHRPVDAVVRGGGPRRLCN